MPQPAVDARGLTKSFGAHVAVDGVDLTVQRGRCVGIVGRNGAGKSTLMRMLTTVMRPTAGQLRVLDLDPVRDAKAIKSGLGVVPQSNNLDEDLTAIQNLEIHARYFRMNRRTSRAAALEGLELAGLAARARSSVSALSGGMKRRLVIARAMLNDPELLLLDEPTTALDAQSKHHIWSTLGRLRAEGRSILIMSHDMDEVEMLCDQVLIMDEGRFVTSGAPHELIARYCRGACIDIVIENASSYAWEEILHDADANPRSTARGIVVGVRDAPSSIEALRSSKVPFTAATVRPSGLIDVYLQVTGREAI